MPQPANIAIITSRFNENITTKLYEGTHERLMYLGVGSSNCHPFSVPGAVEIPIIAQHLATTKKYDAIIALGAVIRGETTHYDYVCAQVSNGCQSVALQSGIPVIFGILTTENEEQAEQRVGGAYGHKGHDCAEAAVEMIHLIRTLQES